MPPMARARGSLKRFRGAGPRHSANAAIGRALLRNMKPGMYRNPTAGYWRMSGLYGGVLEKKYHEFHQGPTAKTSGQVVTHQLSLIPQGDTAVKRVGRKAILHNINFRMEVAAGEVTQVASAIVSHLDFRVALILDKQCNGAAAAFADVFDTTTNSIITRAYQRLDNQNRFQVLYDKRFALNLSEVAQVDATITAGTCKPMYGSRVIQKALKVKIPLEFETATTSGALTTLRSNNVYIYVTSTNGAWVYNLSTRLRFTD